MSYKCRGRYFRTLAGATAYEAKMHAKDGTFAAIEEARQYHIPYQPKTGERCGCKRGVMRDNCGNCEGTGWVIDFRAIRERTR